MTAELTAEGGGTKPGIAATMKALGGKWKELGKDDRAPFEKAAAEAASQAAKLRKEAQSVTSAAKLRNPRQWAVLKAGETVHILDRI